LGYRQDLGDGRLRQWSADALASDLDVTPSSAQEMDLLVRQVSCCQVMTVAYGNIFNKQGVYF